MTTGSTTETASVPQQRQAPEQPVMPAVSPYLISDDTWLIPNHAPAAGVLLPVNTMVIRGAQPVIVDTGAPIHRESVIDQGSR